MWLAVNIITDFILAVFPATFLWQLNIQLRKKIGLMLVMGLGILSASPQLSFSEILVKAHELQFHGRYNYQGCANQVPRIKIR